MGIREEDHEDEDKLPKAGSEQDNDEEGQENPDAEGEVGEHANGEDEGSLKSEGDDEETDEEREAIRERRRLERQRKKEHQREEKETLRRELASRDAVINEMREKLNILERKSTGAEAAQIDVAIKQAQQAYAHQRQQVAMAAAAGDGEALVTAQERMYQAMRRHEDLTRVKQAYDQRQAAPQPLDPRLRNHAENWLKKNSWYDPSGGDSDSRIALTVDNDMAREGWNPTTEEYWQELDSRLKRYMPHRYAAPKSQPAAKPRSPVAGSGKDSAAAPTGTYKLSAERVAALKEAGLWADTKQREEAIKRFKEYDKQNAAR